MKILFIAPEEESLAVEYLSAAARAAGHRTALAFDPCLFRDQYLYTNPWLARRFDLRPFLIEKVKHLKPDLIAFSVVSAYRHWAAEMTLAVKKVSDAPVVWGGHHVTAAPDALLADGFADYLIIGEGDAAFVELLERLDSGRDPSDVQNLWGRAAGREFKNAPRPLIEDLDSLPFPDKSLYNKESFSFRDAYCITASRGCAYACRFCHHSGNRKLYGGKGYYRFRSVDSVIEELIVARNRYPYKFVRFLDDLFPPTEPGWLEEFAYRYSREVGVPWWSYAYPDRLTPEMVPLLKESGCAEVAFGVQTIDPQLRRSAASRSSSNEKIAHILQVLADHDIQVSTSNIVNLPGENDDHLLQLLRFYNDNRPTKVLTVPIMYLPGTGITEMAHKFGQVSDEQRDEVDCAGEVLYSHELPQFEQRSPLMRKIPTMMALMPLLSRPTVDVLLKDEGWKKVPELPFWMVFILNQILVLVRGGSRDRTPLKRFFGRYADYALRIAKLHISGRMPPNNDFAPTNPTAGKLYQKPDSGKPYYSR
jgi:Radical SAM superfamily/B12 binding domain